MIVDAHPTTDRRSALEAGLAASACRRAPSGLLLATARPAAAGRAGHARRRVRGTRAGRVRAVDAPRPRPAGRRRHGRHGRPAHRRGVGAGARGALPGGRAPRCAPPARSSGGDGSETTEETAGQFADNPHIRFSDNRRGYVHTRFTADELTAEFRALPYVREAGAPLETRATFVVEDRRPGLNPA